MPSCYKFNKLKTYKPFYLPTKTLKHGGSVLHVGGEVAGGAQTEQPNKCGWNIGLITIAYSYSFYHMTSRLGVK